MQEALRLGGFFSFGACPPKRMGSAACRSNGAEDECEGGTRLAQVANKPSRKAWIVVLLLLGVGLLGAWWWGQRWVTAMLGPVDPAAQQVVEVEIPPGMGTVEVANLLHERGLIKDPTFFRYYTRYRELDAQLKSGEYQFSAAMTPDQILEKLIRGEFITYKFTLPEGLTVQMMADALAEQGVASPEEFLAAVRALVASNPYLPEGAALAQPMEGYLFPATYEYRKGATVEQIVAMLQERFDQVWTAEYRQRAEALGLSVHQVVTLASIVEAEAQVAAERPRIAGVYLNRLKMEWLLQADPTVYYGIDLPRGEALLYEHLAIDTPYNTYMHPGLPPGPIGAPGEDSIHAVLYPEEHDYYFFVAKADGTGEHYFSQTLDEHNANVAQAEANKNQ